MATQRHHSHEVTTFHLDLSVFFEGKLDEGELALLVRSWLLLGGGCVQVDDYLCTADFKTDT